MRRLLFLITAAAIALPGINGAAAEQTDEKKPPTGMKVHSQASYADRKAFRQKMHDDDMRHLKQRLDQNSSLTNEEKDRLVRLYERQYSDNSARWEQRTHGDIAFFNRVKNDSRMTNEEKDAAIKEHFNKVRLEDKAYREEQKIERKAFWQKLKQEHKEKAIEVQHK